MSEDLTIDETIEGNITKKVKLWNEIKGQSIFKMAPNPTQARRLKIR